MNYEVEDSGAQIFARDRRRTILLYMNRSIVGMHVRLFVDINKSSYTNTFFDTLGHK
jgi:hypothetical protein